MAQTQSQKQKERQCVTQPDSATSRGGYLLSTLHVSPHVRRRRCRCRSRCHFPFLSDLCIVKMKLAVATVTLLISGVAAFAPSTPSRRTTAVVSAQQTATTLFAGPPEEEEEGGLDLDLGEMFDMYVIGYCRMTETW